MHVLKFTWFCSAAVMIISPEFESTIIIGRENSDKQCDQFIVQQITNPFIFFDNFTEMP